MIGRDRMRWLSGARIISARLFVSIIALLFIIAIDAANSLNEVKGSSSSVNTMLVHDTNDANAMAAATHDGRNKGNAGTSPYTLKRDRTIVDTLKYNYASFDCGAKARDWNREVCMYVCMCTCVYVCHDGVHNT